MAKKKARELDWTDTEEEIIWVSKSEIKRDAEALKRLGSALVDLTPTNLAKIPLDEDLKDAIHTAQRLKLEAKRRQIQFIGKLLRNRETDAIQEALDKVENRHEQQLALLQKLEILRDQLLAQGDAKINALVSDYPALDRQQLRTLVRGAQKEQTAGKLARNFRELYQYLKNVIAE